MTTKAVRGASWTIATSVGSRAIGLVGTLAITYFLVPDIIGEVSDASVLILSAMQLSTIGVGQYVIAKPDSGRDVAWHATVFHMALGLLAIGLVTLFRDRFGGFLSAPTMARYVPGLALAAVFDRVAFMPERLLARDMQFRVIGLSRTVGEVTYSIASVALAFAGLGGMALVLANVARSILRCAMLCMAVDRREWLTPSPLSKKTTRAMLAFGLPFSVSASASFAARRWDNLLVSNFFGPTVLGEYNLAYNLADIPAVQVGEQIGDVLLPSFSHMGAAQRKRALVRSTALLALIVFPLAVGLGAVANTAVATLLRKEWHSVGPMLTLLAALSVARPVGWTIASYLVAREMTRPLMWLGLFQVGSLLACIAAIGRAGPLWTCVAVGVAFAAHALASMVVVARADNITVGSLVMSCVGPLLACIPLVLAVIGARHGLAWLGEMPRGVGLVVEIIAGALGYVAGALFLARKTAADFLGLVRSALGRRKAPPAPLA
ncbi:oligosaccharide flippase family protein [Pendulispora rubella]|uniref:Oligosaccharide flippase family protein n=1 Tax=Pendulispora rubella TaxID=2741070 RepID=A0ABZ2KXC9_9BACT